MMAAEFQLPTPIVPTRSTYFARYSKKHADGICANADKTIRSSHPIQLMRFHCRPSGCLIEETAEQLQVLKQQKSTGLTYWQKESRRMKRIDSEGNRLAKLVNEMDTVVAHTLDDMGNGVIRGKVQTQPSNSSNTQLANHGKLNGDKCGNTGLKITGIPRKYLSKLVKHFSDGLKNSQDTLIQIASLPPPPFILLEPIYTVERFKGIIRVNSACTINPSSVQVRDYFHKEEALRGTKCLKRHFLIQLLILKNLQWGH